ncbi:dephospho-CoA kinase [Arthrobacter ginsengisoli]|uniref:Dephospho-CoA kinase n=1 Tax=Arthrobacter ginsengisoli TaxID=1356565 RepID=A0ABU1UCL8_9MICC|nr:dephospho-CoA kinase [Arthrobacter ginsengisoli]MDR7082855.1 dephospho-CoA kinase [Arthrobacter ginsengisoli]
MLKIGLTGGIASGKSVAAARLRELGAVVIDADALAREVVEPGTPGLARVVGAFSKAILSPDGGLDRPKLGALVFGNPERLAVLNSIIHPLVRERAAALAASAPKGAVVVQDIPLLVETGQGANFHLVVVVDAPDDVRVQRMVQHRHMTAADARARMAAQAGRELRLAAADAVLDNSGAKEELRDAVDRLWKFRLAPFAENLARHRLAARSGGPVLTPANPDWPAQADRLIARLRAAAAPDVLTLDHVGSTAVPGLAAKDVLDLQLGVEDMAAAERIAPLLADAGFPAWPGIISDNPKPSRPDPADWAKRLHGNADPGRAVNLHVRAVGSPGWRFALCFRDWLREDAAARADYLAEKRRVAKLHGVDKSTAGYAADKEGWFADYAAPRMESWARHTGWHPPSYTAPATAPVPEAGAARGPGRTGSGSGTAES